MHQQYTITAPATALNANIDLPASKSISNRALILHALSGGNATPQNLSVCDDTEVMVSALRYRRDVIDIKAAGTAMRFLTAYLSTCEGEEHTLTGTDRMKHRPIGTLVNALRTLGADITYAGEEGYPPLTIRGRRLAADAPLSIAGSVSSQYISALLMTGPVMKGGLHLHLTGDIVSRPYIDLTLQMMRDFGASARWTAADNLEVGEGGYCDTLYIIENDWSAASYWYEMVALAGGKVLLRGLFPDSPQGDSKGASLFGKLGVQTRFTSDGVEICRKGAAVERLDENLVNIPDLAQTFVVCCCLMGIPFRFSGLQSLRIKETDRMAALATELRKLGYVIDDTSDSVLSWDGQRCPCGPQPVIATYEDHRMAMSFAPAALLLPQVCIDRPEVVSKSYPSFWDDLRLAGFGIDASTVG